MSIEANLPNAKYIQKFTKTQMPNWVRVRLEVRLSKLFRDFDALKDFILEYGIPIDDISWSGGWVRSPRITYTGKSKEFGDYSLSSGEPEIGVEEIILDASNTSDDFGKISDLVTVVRKYVSLYEKKREEQKRKSGPKGTS